MLGQQSVIKVDMLKRASGLCFVTLAPPGPNRLPRNTWGQAVRLTW